MLRNNTEFPCDLVCPNCGKHLDYYHKVKMNSITKKPYFQMKSSQKTYWQKICPFCTAYLLDQEEQP